MISSPELFAKSIVSWAAAGADAKDLEDANLALEKEVGILERSLRDANSRIEAMKLHEIEQRQAATEKARHELENAYSASPHQEHSRNPVHPQRRLDNSFFLGNANPADDGQGPEYTYRAFPQQETSRSPSRSQRRGDKSSFFEYADPTNNEDNATPRTFVNPRLHQAFMEDDERPRSRSRPVAARAAMLPFLLQLLSLSSRASAAPRVNLGTSVLVGRTRSRRRPFWPRLARPAPVALRRGARRVVAR
ncbi:hypothetical protein Tdes44962_MAKER07949 [Teratosphaeria destructans]|uniref:Uncharacterized protein n=1 Tax=Teratosphaeria destructans TaxID=418781 RepID=A0A9W7SXH9_9PEZI|nr:hypothetical protein Tdes44962_MAKER07949 [Teratosphaeria destructans]